MTEELISVLIPVFNAERYIGETLRSVLSQSRHEIEVIVLDDGSIDKSADIIRSFHDERLRYFFEENRGVGYARNRLLELARGSMVLFVDADDVLSPLFIERLFEEKKRNGASIAASSVVPFRRKMRERKKREGESRVCTGLEYVRLMVRPGGVFCYPHSRLIDRSLFSGLSFPADMIFEDVVLMPQVVLRSERVVIVGSAVYHYRINRAGLSHAPFSLRALDEMTAYLSNIELGLKIGDREIVHSSCLFFLTKYYFYYWRVLFRRLGIHEYRERFSGEKKRVIRLLKGKKV